MSPPERRNRASAPSAPLPPARRDAIRRRLLAWYTAARRDLPWRRTRDPYRIWLSESMLQQTRVETVIPYYERFVRRFPTASALACADLEDVLREWAGLGYYARARNLKRAAERIVQEHAGRVPNDPSLLAGLPGVGRYTAGAVASIAFGRPEPVVDGNVSRVLSRIEALLEPAAPLLWGLAAALVPADRPGDFNQALMELGATLCTPRAPACPKCPLSRICRGRRSGDPERFAYSKKRAAPRSVRATAGVLRRRGRKDSILLVRRAGRGLLGGLWELPNVDGSDQEALVRSVRERFGLETAPGDRLGRVSHVFTHRRLTLDVVALRHREGRPPPADDVRWCTERDLEALPLSALTRKSLRVAGLEVPPPGGGRSRRPRAARNRGVDPSPAP